VQGARSSYTPSTYTPSASPWHVQYYISRTVLVNVYLQCASRRPQTFRYLRLLCQHLTAF
jgi:hypothetical protein